MKIPLIFTDVLLFSLIFTDVLLFSLIFTDVLLNNLLLVRLVNKTTFRSHGLSVTQTITEYTQIGLTVDILRTLTHPLVVVGRGAGPTLATVLARHAVTVHLRTVPPLVALRTGAVVATLVVQTGGSIGAWTLLFAFIIVFPTVRT